MSPWLIAGFSALAVALPLVAWLLWRQRRREHGLRELLDLADAVQALLGRADSRIAAWHDAAGRLAGDLANGAQQALEVTPLIRDAKRDLLRHRLWLQQHGQRAGMVEIDTARATLLRVKLRLESKLDALDQVGDALARATDATRLAASREPPSLRRGE